MADATAFFNMIELMEIMKNQELYERKIKELKEEYQKLSDATFIAKTVDQANKIKQEANELKKKYEGVLEKAKEEASAILTKAKEDAAAQFDRVKELKKKVDEQNQRVNLRMSEQEELKILNEKRTEELQKWDQWINEQKEILQTTETMYNSKIQAIKDIMNS